MLDSAMAWDARNGTESGDETIPLQGGTQSGGHSLHKQPLVSAPVTSKWAKGSGGPAGDEAQNLVAEVVGPLQTGESPRGHGHAGVNDQAVADGHVIAVPDEPVMFTEAYYTRPENSPSGAPGPDVPPLRAEDHAGDTAPLVAATLKAEQGRGFAISAEQADNLIVAPDEAATLKGQRGKAGGGIGPEETLIVPDEAATLTSSGNAKSLPNRQKEDDVNLIATVQTAGHATANGLGIGDGEVAPTLDVTGRTGIAYSKRHGASNVEDAETWDQTQSWGDPVREGEVETLEGSQGMKQAVTAYHLNPDDKAGGTGALKAVESDVAPPLTSTEGERTTDRGTRLASALGVRRLTPVECERLQGFPDGWTAVDGDETPDGRRYAALGDAVTVPVAEWIARRLVEHG